MTNKGKNTKADNLRRSYSVPSKEITFSKFQLPEKGMDDSQREAALKELKKYIDKRERHFFGYQATQNIDFQGLKRYLDVSINNIGDSFSNPALEDEANTPRDGYFGVNSKWIERAVLDYYAELWNARHPRLVKEDEEEGWEETYWGYVLSMGSTEGNLLAMRSARDYLNGTRLEYSGAEARRFLQANRNDPNSLIRLPLQFINHRQCVKDDSNPNKYTPILFFSDTTHYSVKKIAQILNIKTFGEVGESQRGFRNVQQVPTHKDGTINLDILAFLVDFFGSRGYPMIFNLNYGTTWTGAYDNVKEACEMITEKLKRYGLYEREVTFIDQEGNEQKEIRRGYWIHVDGALGASFAPFLKKSNSEYARYLPDFDFNLDIQSISTSGHKWMGAPWPCGIYMTKNKYLISNDVPSYVGSLDSTLAGSRNGFSPLLYWDFLSQHSYEDQCKEVEKALELAEYACSKLTEFFNSKDKGEDQDKKVSRAPGSLAVVFPKPPNLEVIKDYSLASSGDYSHIFVMRNINKAHIDKLVADLKDRGGYDDVSPKTLSRTSSSLDDMLQQGW